MAQTIPAMAEQNLVLDDLFSGTFQSVLRIEEQALDNRLTAGLSMSDIHTITAIGLYEQNSMSVVAERLEVTLATLTSAVKKLERLGYVHRERSEEDRRQVLISLTAKGRKAYHAHRLFHEKMIAAALEGLTPEEQQVLARALASVKGFFDSGR